jgi:glycosyltransferase involved in cell wall biosynthesis
MRIALVAPEIPDYAIEYARTIGGTAQTLLLIPDRHRPDERRLEASGVEVDWLNWPRQRQVLSSISFMRRMASRIKDWKPDLVHILMNGHVWTTALMRLFRPLPVITTVHDVRLHPGDGTAARIPNLFFDLGVRQSAAIVLHGETLRRQAMAKWFLKTEQCFVLPHVPLWRYKEIAEEEGFRRPDDGVFRILFFGRICEYKGLNYLLRSAEILELSGKRVKLVIAGRGDLSPYRQAIARLSSVEVHDHYVSAREASRFFAEADVLALPYIEASQSGVLMIAMTFGLPVVATEVGEIGETVSSTGVGLLVPPRDPDLLADALDRIAEDETLRRSAAENAIRALETQYSRLSLSRNALSIYERVRDSARQSIPHLTATSNSAIS